MAKHSKKLVRGEEAVEEIIRRLRIEFGVSRRDVLGGGQRGKNFVRLIAIVLARELSGLDARGINRAFGASPAERGGRARRRLLKYLRYIPGLRRKYEKLKRRLQKKLVDFDV